MMPECGCPMCDECARDSLINSDKNECPDCGEANNSPDDLIPWRQLRDKVTKVDNIIVCIFSYISSLSRIRIKQILF